MGHTKQTIAERTDLLSHYVVIINNCHHNQFLRQNVPGFLVILSQKGIPHLFRFLIVTYIECHAGDLDQTIEVFRHRP